MHMKYKRHNQILEIVNEHAIETQDELIERLRLMGYDVTQATISRDIKELGLVKVTTRNNHYKYALPATTEGEKGRNAEKYRTIIREAVISVDSAENITVLKTHPGMASAAAAAIDGLGWEGVVGSMAGDDTIFILLRNAKNATDFAANFQKMLSVYE